MSTDNALKHSTVYDVVELLLEAGENSLHRLLEKCCKHAAVLFLFAAFKWSILSLSVQQLSPLFLNSSDQIHEANF